YQLSSCSYSGYLRALHSFPTRRSSDLRPVDIERVVTASELLPGVGDLGVRDRRRPIAAEHLEIVSECPAESGTLEVAVAAAVAQDRKSTRLNSSHVAISYAVFCLKKKK